ncbi:hypothetical protein ACES2L_00690 [Bdellovibrio bacteriovorus]
MKLSLSKKDFLKIILFAVLFYGPAVYLYYVYLKDRVESQELDQRLKNVESVYQLIEPMVEAGMDAEVCNQLSAETRANRIILFSYKAGNTLCSVPDETPPENFPAASEGIFYSFKNDKIDVSYKKTKLGSGTLVLGYDNPQKHPPLYYLTNSKFLLLTMAAEFALVIWLLLGFTILFVSRNLQKIKNNYAGATNSKTLSSLEFLFGWLTVDDMQVVEEASSETLSKLKALQDNRMFAETSLQYSVISEIEALHKSGKRVDFPYKFKGVTVRVDINGYSSIMTKTSLELTRQINSTFKEQAAELAYRYKGLFENSAGDEVVYCFKDDDALLRGTAFVRDLMKAFSDTSFESGNGQKIKLFVKASLDTSEMLMDIGTSRVEFDGLSLLYTNRMFADMPYKDKNVLIVLPSVASDISALTHKPYETRKIVAKGMELEVSYIDQFKSRKEVGGELATTNYYCSDKDIVEYLKEPNLQALSSLDRIRKVSSEVKDAWISTIDTNIKEFKLRALPPTLMPTLVTVGSQIIPVDQWTEACSEAVLRASRLPLQRVPENTIDALIKVDRYEDAQKVSEPVINTNRYKANSLLAQALAEPNEKNLKAIRLMATTKDYNLRSSGIFAAASLLGAFAKDKNNSVLVLKEYAKLRKILLTATNDKSISARVKNHILEQLAPGKWYS